MEEEEWRDCAKSDREGMRIFEDIATSAPEPFLLQRHSGAEPFGGLRALSLPKRRLPPGCRPNQTAAGAIFSLFFLDATMEMATKRHKIHKRKRFAQGRSVRGNRRLGHDTALRKSPFCAFCAFLWLFIPAKQKTAPRFRGAAFSGSRGDREIFFAAV